ncbi:MAG: helix-turn-helix transcriptional regulator [Chloroflexi bacterium]|nr:helix-turn-helix transcriptional regulator [Chloroflexota bacterium]
MIFDFDTRGSELPLVQSIWRSRSEGGGSFISTATSQWEMVVTQQKDHLTLSVRGPETRASLAPVPVEAEFFGVVFQHGVFMPQLPKSELVDHAIHLTASIKNRFQFLGSTWEFPTFDNIDTFVARLVRAGILSFDTTVADVLGGQTLYLSQRSIQRRFLYVTGLTYKTIQQIKRARQASLLLKEGVPIAETAHETGYFDQAHLTNSLKRYYGQTPVEIANQARLHSGVFFQDENSPAQ